MLRQMQQILKQHAHAPFSILSRPATAFSATHGLQLRSPITLFVRHLTLPRRALQCSSAILLSRPRTYSTIEKPAPLQRSAEQTSNPPEQPTQQTAKPPVPSYDITFTCRPCGARSTHRISKQGYHKGSVLITCPSCTARHIISDHLNMFGDKVTDIEVLMAEKGEAMKRGRIGENGSIEYWTEDSPTNEKKD